MTKIFQVMILAFKWILSFLIVMFILYALIETYAPLSAFLFLAALILVLPLINLRVGPLKHPVVKAVLVFVLFIAGALNVPTNPRSTKVSITKTEEKSEEPKPSKHKIEVVEQNEIEPEEAPKVLCNDKIAEIKTTLHTIEQMQRTLEKNHKALSENKFKQWIADWNRENREPTSWVNTRANDLDFSCCPKSEYDTKLALGQVNLLGVNYAFIYDVANKSQMIKDFTVNLEEIIGYAREELEKCN